MIIICLLGIDRNGKIIALVLVGSDRIHIIVDKSLRVIVQVLVFFLLILGRSSCWRCMVRR